MTPKDLHTHAYHYSYSVVKPSAYSGDRDGYIYDILHCQECGHTKEIFVGQKPYSTALSEVEQRNNNNDR